MLPSLTQGHCSMFGAWGNATMKSQNGDLIQLRALDWYDKCIPFLHLYLSILIDCRTKYISKRDTDGPFKDFPMVSVYHPTDGNAFANIAFTGFIGSITG